jgi:hypothetical protein
MWKNIRPKAEERYKRKRENSGENSTHEASF